MTKSQKTQKTNTRGSRRKSNQHVRPNSRSRKPSSRPHNQNQKLSFSQKLILVIIALVFLLVTFSAIFVLNYNVKYQVEAKISDLSHEYYENHFYPQAVVDTTNAESILAQFSESGLSPLPLRELILNSEDLSDSDKAFIRSYCDENSTTIKYYPDSPYSADSYHAEFHYYCNF